MSLDPESFARRAGALARETWSGESAPGDDARERARFEGLVAYPRKRRIPPLAVLAAAAVLIAGTVFVVHLSFPSRLAYEIVDSSSNDGSYVSASRTEPATARFEDGTDVRIAPGGRARIVDTDRHGARLALEQGRASLHVVHLPGARWSVDAGPFSIAVTGTVFDVDWSGTDERLVVELTQGSVVVRGPFAKDGIGLSSGQRLVASVHDGQIHIEPLSRPTADAAPASGDNGEAGSVERPSAPEATEPPSADVATGALPPPSASALSPATSWEERVRAGDFDRVLRDAKARGIDTTLRDATRSDLTALADAARYTGAVDVAERALGAIEKRFPGSPDSRAAPFLLGRLAEGRGARSEAIALYDQYLTASPHGPFVAEALGRKLLAVKSRDGDDAARPIAREYLVRFPKGPYAETARKLISTE